MVTNKRKERRKRKCGIKFPNSADRMPELCLCCGYKQMIVKKERKEVETREKVLKFTRETN